MQIKKEYKFYAGHRNQTLLGKCARPHGHFYQLSCFFDVIRLPGEAVTSLFEEFDNIIEPMLKDQFDHRFFLDTNDKLAETFAMHFDKFDEDLGAILLPFPSSVENVAFILFHRINKGLGGKVFLKESPHGSVEEFQVEYPEPLFHLLRSIELKETSSSTVIYDLEDYLHDLQHSFKKQYQNGSFD